MTIFYQIFHDFKSDKIEKKQPFFGTLSMVTLLKGIIKGDKIGGVYLHNRNGDFDEKSCASTLIMSENIRISLYLRTMYIHLKLKLEVLFPYYI